MNVLADRHHGDLYYSLQLLGDRLGWELFTPVGTDWFTEGYWAFDLPWDPGALARQYLSPDGWTEVRPGIFSMVDGAHPDRQIFGVTLATAREMGWDAVLATLQQNQRGFHRFAQEKSAKYLVQVGNTGQEIDWSLRPLVLNSSEMPMLGRGVQYHQEFDYTDTFRFRDPAEGDRYLIRSFVHLLPETICWPTWQWFRAALPEFTFTRYGHAPKDPDPTYAGNINPVSRIADLMAASGWGWHDKPHGDGFGHVLHNWAAVGRPLIGHGSHYRGKTGAVFWRDLETCIDLDRHSEGEAVELIRAISADPERHRAMCVAIRRVLEDQLDYSAEAEQIRGLLA